MAADQGQAIKVGVSGIGTISAAGQNTAANFANMIKGNRQPKPFPDLFKSEVKKPVFECEDNKLNQTLLPNRRTFALCVKALQEALADANLHSENLKGKKIGVCIGTTVACTLNDLDFYSQVRQGKSPEITPLKRYFCGDISLAVAEMMELNGPTISVANACSSGTNAIAIGYSWIKSGACDLVITGGADELNLIPYCGFNSLQVMSDDYCRPFDKRRRGLNLGEGAGILILENLSSAAKRGISVEVELLSFGEGCDAYHITGPHPEGRGLKNAISKAIETADMSPSDIDYINAHGTATINNDKVESRVFAEFFGNEIPFSSTKYFTGHTLGAAGAIEAAICVKGIQEGCFPGMGDMEKADDVPISPATSTIAYKGGGVISTSMAFGGSCAALIFAKLNNNIPITNSEKSSDIHFQNLSLDQSVNKILDKAEENCTMEMESTSLNCVSVGVIGPFGWGKEVFKDALYDSFTMDDPIENQMEIAMIPNETFQDPRIKRMRRRADRLSMAMYCSALEAIESAKLKSSENWEEGRNTALLAVTPLGAYKTTFKFLDGILDFGQLAPSPTHFSNSVHNAPAFYITSGLGINGPSLTLTGFNNSFCQALKLAENMLEQEVCNQVLLVVGDEVCDEFQKMSQLWFNEFSDNIPKKWGEGSVAFLLNRNAPESSLPVIKTTDIATAGITEKIIGKTLINAAFAMAAEIIRGS